MTSMMKLVAVSAAPDPFGERIRGHVRSVVIFSPLYRRTMTAKIDTPVFFFRLLDDARLSWRVPGEWQKDSGHHWARDSEGVTSAAEPSMAGWVGRRWCSAPSIPRACRRDRIDCIAACDFGRRESPSCDRRSGARAWLRALPPPYPCPALPGRCGAPNPGGPVAEDLCRA